MAATFMLNPLANISGSSTSDPRGMPVEFNSDKTFAQFASFFSQAMSNWTQAMFMARKVWRWGKTLSSHHFERSEANGVGINLTAEMLAALAPPSSANGVHRVSPHRRGSG